MVVDILSQTQECGALVFGGLRTGRRLDRASGCSPFEVGSVTGVNQVDGVGAEVGEVKSVKVIGTQLEDADDFLAIEVEDFEASVREDSGQAEEDVLDREGETAGQFLEDGLVDVARVDRIERGRCWSWGSLGNGGG